jgi:membrane protein
VTNFVPFAKDIVEANIDSLLAARTTMSIVALGALVWSASGMFIAVYRAVNRVWENPKSELFWAEKLFGLAVTLTIGGLLLAGIVVQTVLSVLRGWLQEWPQLQSILSQFSGWPSRLLTVVIPIAAFIVLYRIVPRGKAAWRDVWLGGLIGGLAWVFITWLFGWYVGGVVRTNPIYGSVGGIAAFLLWAYWGAMVLLTGASFTAQYSRWRQAGRPLEERPLREWMAAWPE